MTTSLPVLPRALLARRQSRTDGLYLYRHPSHRHAVRFTTAPASRSCSVCGYRWRQGGPDRANYACAATGCTISICSQCMISPYSSWAQQQTRYLSGSTLILPGFLRLGSLQVPEWPELDDHAALLTMLDTERARGDLLDAGSELRELHLRGPEVAVVRSDGTLVQSVPFTRLVAALYLHDHPKHYVLLLHDHYDDRRLRDVRVIQVLEAHTAEHGRDAVDSIDHAIDFLYTTATMAEMDAAIDAGGAPRVGPSRLERAAQAAQLEQAQWRHQRRLDEARRIAADEEAALQRAAEAEARAAEAEAEAARRHAAEAHAAEQARLAELARMHAPPLPQAQAAPLSPEEAAARARMRTLAADAMSAAHIRRTSMAAPFSAGLHSGYPSSTALAPEPAPAPAVEDTSGAAAQRHVQEYMLLLQGVLTPAEMREFAKLLRGYREGLPFSDFAAQLQAIYGPQRTHLLPGLEPFVPHEDRPEYYEFLQAHGLHGMYG